MRQCVKSIFGVLKWSISPKNFDILLCVQTWWCHGVLKPLRISMNWMWNSVLDKTDKMSNFGIPLKNRKKGSIVGQSHLEMHILCILSFFVCSKKNMSNATFCSIVWKPPWRITRWQHGCKAKILTTGIVWWSDTLGTWAGNSQSIHFSLHVNHYWLVVWNIFSIYWE